METLDPRGTPGLLPRPELFVTYLMFVFGLGRVETILYRSQYSSCIFSLPCHLSEVVPNPEQQQGGPKCEVKVCEGGINLCLSGRRQKKGPPDKRQASRVRVSGVCE